jgi:hypothetical protein
MKIRVVDMATISDQLLCSDNNLRNEFATTSFIN